MGKFYLVSIVTAFLWTSPVLAQSIQTDGLGLQNGGVCQADAPGGAPLDGVIIGRLSAVLGDSGSTNLQRTVRRERDPGAEPIGYNSVLHSSCASYSQDIKTLIERSLMHAIYSTERCSSRFRFSELATLRSVLRNLEIRCDPTISALAQASVHYGRQNAMQARTLTVTINSSRFDATSGAPNSERINDIKQLSSLIFHEALHLTNADNRFDHNDALTSNRLGYLGQECNAQSLYNDRIYFIQGVCTGDIFRMNAACEQVCTRALTVVDQPADVHFGRPYAAGDARQICRAVTNFRARVNTAVRGPEYDLQTYFDRVQRIGSDLLASMSEAPQRRVKQFRDRLYVLSVNTYSVRSIIEFGRSGILMHDSISSAWDHRDESQQLQSLTQIPQAVINIDRLISDIEQACRAPEADVESFCAGPRTAFIAELNRQRVMLTNFPQDVADWYSDPAPADLSEK